MRAERGQLPALDRPYHNCWRLGYAIRGFVVWLPSAGLPTYRVHVLLIFLSTIGFLFGDMIMSLLTDYSTTIAQQLSQTAVVLPGAPVAIGDVLFFKQGVESEFLFFKRVVPVGRFLKVSSLSAIDPSLQLATEPGFSTNFNPMFSSSSSTKFTFKAGAKNVPTPIGGVPTSAGGTLEIQFNQASATYFAALGCKVLQAKDLIPLFDAIPLLAQALHRYWQYVFVVVGVRLRAKIT